MSETALLSSLNPKKLSRAKALLPLIGPLPVIPAELDSTVAAVALRACGLVLPRLGPMTETRDPPPAPTMCRQPIQSAHSLSPPTCLRPKNAKQTFVRSMTDGWSPRPRAAANSGRKALIALVFSRLIRFHSRVRKPSDSWTATMRMSRYFLPILRETPKEAEIVSHRLMLRAGMMRQEAAGIYAWLPLGFRVLKKIEQIVREEQDRAGALELLMPTLQLADLWRESGRYDAYGPEMLRITDRHKRELLYGPTNEEMITEIFRSYVKSYKSLPLNLYHIQWKFRDEQRPRFGVMRGREFLMKDAYSFDVDEAAARRSYNKMFVAYLRTFARMGLKAIPMRAETGPIGGDLSHEFI